MPRLRKTPIKSILLFVLLTFVVPFFAVTAQASDYYQWTDEEGTVHFSEVPSDVPPRHRNQAEAHSFEKRGTPDSQIPSKPAPKNRHRPAPDFDSPATEDLAPRRYAIPYTDSEGSARRVIIDVTFNDRITVPMVFDTGAFETLIFPALAKKLGVYDRDQPKLTVRSGGIGGSAPAIRTIIDSMRVRNFRSDFVPVKVIKKLSNAFEGIIGLDFISDYDIRIDPKKKVVIFEEIVTEGKRYGGRDELWWRRYFMEFGNYRSDWKRLENEFKKTLSEQSIRFNSEKDQIKKWISLSDYFHQEAEKLFNRLNRHATINSVPMHWRRYRD